MKSVLTYILILFSTLPALAQFSIGGVKEPTNDASINLGFDSKGLPVIRAKGGAIKPLLINPKANSLPVFSSISGLQSLSLTDATAPNTITVFTPNMAGVFNYVPGDNATLNDGVLNLRTAPIAGHPNGLLFHRQYDGLVNVKWFNVYGDGIHDDNVGMQNAINFSTARNLGLYWPEGTYNTSLGLTANLSSASGPLVYGGSRPSFVGSGSASSLIRYTGTTPTTVLKVIGTGDDGVRVEGLGILAADPNLKVATGLAIEHAANYNITKVRVTTMRLGLDITDAGEGIIDKSVFNYNKVGAFGINGAHGVAPNGNVFLSCAFNSNEIVGLAIVNGSNNKVVGCQVLGNGTGTADTITIRNILLQKRSIFFQYLGFNGGNAGSITDNYIEGNRGPACLELKFANGGIASITGNTINRLGTQFTTNDILLSATGDLQANDTRKILVKLNNSYSGYNNYTPNAANKRLAFSFGVANYNGFIIEDSDDYTQSVTLPDGVTKTNSLVERPNYPIAGVKFQYVSTDLYNVSQAYQATVDNTQDTKTNSLSTAVSTNTIAIAGKVGNDIYAANLSFQAAVDDAQNTKANSLSTSVASLTSNKLDKVGGTANSLTVTNLSAYGFLQGGVSGVIEGSVTANSSSSLNGTFIGALANATGTLNGTANVASSVTNNAVTNAGLAQMATNTIKANLTGGTANASDVTLASLKTALGLTGTNSGDQDLSGLLVKSNNLSDLPSASTARTNLGLGTMATQNQTAVAIVGGVVSGVLGTNVSLGNSSLNTTTITSSSFTGGVISNVTGSNVTLTSANLSGTLSGSLVNPYVSGNITGTGNLTLGSGATGASTNPTNINLGSTTSSVPGANFKFDLYNDGIPANRYGLGMSSAQMDIGAPNGAKIAFLFSGTRTGYADASGLVATHFSGSSTTPALTLNTGAGTSPTAATIVGNDVAGSISFTSGSSGVTTGVICRVTFAASYGTNPPIVTLTATSDGAVLNNQTWKLGTVTATYFEIINPATSTFPASTTWAGNYHVIGRQ
ncbi:hypothetical protein IC229_27500 [Spirosoma sp. BT702]|uniref:Pectate lyase superfamily protein domain-containing protein n=1 Tax=Spirosoma profusum TaxID=2771354 RepID=A0A926Y3S2_9BACT|nr:hypothetical protein [Spirosoma profusum]MBD2704417.1 hypothetical protein [Spirosoma profusum]